MKTSTKKSSSQAPDLSIFGRLAEYNRKRRFEVTPEPAGKQGRGGKKLWNSSSKSTAPAACTTIFAWNTMA